MIIYATKVIFLKFPVSTFFSLLECKKRKVKSHGKRNKGNIKR